MAAIGSSRVEAKRNIINSWKSCTLLAMIIFAECNSSCYDVLQDSYFYFFWPMTFGDWQTLNALCLTLWSWFVPTYRMPLKVYEFLLPFTHSNFEDTLYISTTHDHKVGHHLSVSESTFFSFLIWDTKRTF